MLRKEFISKGIDVFDAVMPVNVTVIELFNEQELYNFILRQSIDVVFFDSYKGKYFTIFEGIIITHEGVIE